MPRKILLPPLLPLLAILLGPSAGPSPGWGGEGPPPGRFEVGRPFPDLSFPAVDGGLPRSIRDFRGERVLLHVFASW